MAALGRSLYGAPPWVGLILSLLLIAAGVGALWIVLKIYKQYRKQQLQPDFRFWTAPVVWFFAIGAIILTMGISGLISDPPPPKEKESSLQRALERSQEWMN